MAEVSLGKCEVCDDRPAIGVASMPGACSGAFCAECAQAGALPFWHIVAYTACLGDMSQAADWWVNTVEASLRRVGKSQAEFNEAVAKSVQSLEERLREEAPIDG